jgi:hypothetical protein
MEPVRPEPDPDALPFELASDSTKRTITIQIVRSAAQGLGSLIVAYPLVLYAADAAGVPVDETGIARSLFVVGLVLWILLLRLLERVHPMFRALNGWTTGPSYVEPGEVLLADDE